MHGKDKMSFNRKVLADRETNQTCKISWMKVILPWLLEFEDIWDLTATSIKIKSKK